MSRRWGRDTLLVLLGGLFGMSKIWWQPATMISQDRCCRPSTFACRASPFALRASEDKSVDKSGFRASGWCWLRVGVLRRGCVASWGTHLLLGLWAELRWGSARYVPGVVTWTLGVTLLLRFFGSCPSARLCRVLGYKVLLGFCPPCPRWWCFAISRPGAFWGPGRGRGTGVESTTGRCRCASCG